MCHPLTPQFAPNQTLLLSIQNWSFSTPLTIIDQTPKTSLIFHTSTLLQVSTLSCFCPQPQLSDLLPHRLLLVITRSFFATRFTHSCKPLHVTTILNITKKLIYTWTTYCWVFNALWLTMIDKIFHRMAVCSRVNLRSCHLQSIK